jgi:DNA-binding SARP family transcriptional activator
VLRSYLHAALLEEVGEDELHRRFREAAAVLLHAGAVPEALEAYCHAEDWENARRLLASQGSRVADGAHAWVDALPTTVMHDPWLLLASARRLRAEGRIARAIDLYQRAEVAFGSADPAIVCREERLALAWWNEPGAKPRTDGSQRPDASSLLRTAMRHEPMTILPITDKLGGPADSLVGGLAALSAGNAATARRELLHAAQRPDASTQVQVIAGLAAGVAGLLMGQRHATLEVDGAVAAAESLGLEWVSRVGRAAFALTGGREGHREAEAVAVACDAFGDRWGASIARLCLSWGSLVTGRDLGDVHGLVTNLRALDAPVLETWARSMSSLAAVRKGQPDARDEATSAEAFARSTGTNAGRLLAYLALAEAATDPDTADEYGSLADAVASETGLQPPRQSARSALVADTIDDRSTVAPVTIRVFGSFEMRLHEEPIDSNALRPRVRTLLRLLAVNAGRRVHHEAIESALWPEAGPGASSRNLHVAVAALRRALEPKSSRGTFQLIRRDGDAYVLDAPPGSDIDVVRFERAIVAGRSARERGDAAAAVAAYRLALDLHSDDLLPADGPAEWVASRREACRVAAVEASQALAELLLERGEAAAAAKASAAGLKIERYHDPLWRLLIESRDRAGDHGAATKARHGYDRMLAELGIATGEARASSSPL